jgi:hypothetical protein
MTRRICIINRCPALLVKRIHVRHHHPSRLRYCNSTHVQLSVSPAHSHPLVLLLLGQLSHSHLPGAHLHSGSQLHALELDEAPAAAAAAEDDWPVLLGQLAQVQVDPHAHEPSCAQLHELVEAGAWAGVLEEQHLYINHRDSQHDGQGAMGGCWVARCGPFNGDKVSANGGSTRHSRWTG